MISARPWTGVVAGFAIGLCAASVVLAQTRDYTKGCSSSGCHDGYAKLGIVHDPVAENSCDLCHKATDEKAHKFELTLKGNALCQDCHEAFEGEIRHDVVVNGDCTDCHEPHASEHKGLLRSGQAKLCGECHEGAVNGHKYLHGPLAVGSCTACHAPHASAHKKLLVEEGRGLCLKCHTAMKERLTEATHVHEAVADDCVSCHRPHSADNSMFLTQAMPGLCLDCHDDVAEKANDAKVKHSVVAMGRSCGNCHDAHASKHKALLPKASAELCITCHDREVATTDGRKLKNLAEVLAKPVKHGPIEDGDCVTCHAAHGSAFVALATGSYPTAFYAPFAEDAYALCLDCHEGEAMTEAETDKATEFRNGKQNLHYVHVNKSDKGRTCRACHEVHATDRPKLIAESVPFGEWQIPIGFKETETGGSCAPGCHRPYRYDRETAFSNLPARPDTPAN